MALPMDSFHRQYLDEMGIDVFSLRPEKREDGIAEPVEHHGLAEDTPKPLGETAETARQMLKKQLGVGISAEKPPIKVDKKEPPKTVEPISESPRFFFYFLDYENISLLLSLDISLNSLPIAVRQLCDDIVFALSREHKIPKIRDLRWPMVSAAHIQQTSEDARLIVGEMIKQSRDNLILFGSDTAEYRSEKDQGTYLLVESIDHYLQTPIAKAELWKKLTPLLKAL